MTHTSKHVLLALLFVVFIGILIALPSAERVAVAQDPPTNTPTPTQPTATVTPTPTPTIVPGVYIYNKSDTWTDPWQLSAPGYGNCVEMYYDERVQGDYSRYVVTTANGSGWPYGYGVSDDVTVCNFTSSTLYYHVSGHSFANGYSTGEYWVACRGYSICQNFYNPGSELTGYTCTVAGLVLDKGSETDATEGIFTRLDPYFSVGTDKRRRLGVAAHAGSIAFGECGNESHYSYNIELVGEETATALAATETWTAPTATPTRTPTPLNTPTPRRGLEIDSRQSTPEVKPVLVLGLAYEEGTTPTATVTTTPGTRLEFTSHEGTPTQVPILQLGFSNADAATPDPEVTATPTPTATRTPLACIEPTPLPSTIATVGPSIPGGIPIPVDDTFICETEPSDNFGNWSTLSLNDECSILMRWPLAADFFGKTVISAKLRLFLVGQPVENQGDSVFFVNETIPAAGGSNWTELGATWQRRNQSAAWTTLGARAPLLDYNPDTIGYMYVRGMTTGLVDIALSPAAVQGWISSPSTNYGIIIWSETAQNDVRVTASEWYDRRFSPQLILETSP